MLSFLFLFILTFLLFSATALLVIYGRNRALKSRLKQEGICCSGGSCICKDKEKK